MDPRWEAVLFALYVVPSLIVAARRPTMTLLVIAVNLLMGWTIIGWFVSLALALLLPRAAATPPQPGVQQAAGATMAATPQPPAQPAFVIDPMRVATLSLVASLVYQYWWFWRFFEFARRERFPRSRSFWWIFVPFYGWAVLGRLFNDLEARLGPVRPAGYNAQAALALVIASDVSAGWALTLRSFPLVVGTLALSGVFCATALYQVQSAVNAYLRITDADARQAGLFIGEGIAVAAGLAMLGLLTLGTSSPSSGRSAAPVTAVSVLRPSYVPSTPSPTPSVTPAPIPAAGDVLNMTSQQGDYIGQGRSTTMTPPAWRFLANQANGPDTVTVSAETVDPTNFVRWTVWLAAPRGQSLHPGTYVNATRAAFRTGPAPGIDVFGDGRGCNNVYGSFTITKLTMDPQGNVLAFAATFEEHCEQPTAPALRGFVRVGPVDSEQQAQLQPRPLLVRTRQGKVETPDVSAVVSGTWSGRTCPAITPFSF